MKCSLIISSIFLINLINPARAQEVERIIQSGNDFYKNKEFDKAEEKYNKAIEKDSLNTIAKFNLGNALYRLNKKDEAIQTFEELIAKEKQAQSLSRLFYNKAVVLTSQQKLEESIEAYKNALRYNSDDQDARENLQKAILELKKQNADNKKKQSQQKQSPSPKINKKEEEQKLSQLEQKEKEVQQRMQKDKSNSGGSQQKDW